MRIAILNPYTHKAESESAIRIAIAAARLGYEAKEFATTEEIPPYNPDFVLSLSHQDPKLLPIPTYGVLTAPVEYYTSCGRFVRNILTYDGYLTVSARNREWLKDLTFAVRKDFLCEDFANTAPVCFESPAELSADSTLIYFGTNWDGRRHSRLFSTLSRRTQIRYYGPPAAWRHIPRRQYGGAVAFDGLSAITAYREGGVGLCLSRKDFNKSGVPTNRLFETTAAGAVAICGENPFTRRAFGDSVLYVDQDKPDGPLAQDILEHVRWIRHNPRDATEMARRSLHIFNSQLSLDVLLPRLATFHSKTLARKYYRPTPLQKPVHVAFIVRAGGRPLSMLRRALHALETQTAEAKITVHLVLYKHNPDIEAYLQQYEGRLRLIPHSVPAGNRSETLWHGLNAIKESDEADFFAILDDDDEIYPNHLAHLLNASVQSSRSSSNRDYRLFYSGAIQSHNKDVGESLVDGYRLDRWHRLRVGAFSPFSTTRLTTFRFFIPPHSFIASTCLLDDEVLTSPDMNLSEDLYLLMLLAERTEFMFCPEITCSHNFHGDNSGFATHPLRIHYLERLLTRFYRRTFIADSTVSFDTFNHVPHLDEDQRLPAGTAWAKAIMFFLREPLDHKRRLARLTWDAITTEGFVGLLARVRGYIIGKSRQQDS